MNNKNNNTTKTKICGNKNDNKHIINIFYK